MELGDLAEYKTKRVNGQQVEVVNEGMSKDSIDANVRGFFKKLYGKEYLGYVA